MLQHIKKDLGVFGGIEEKAGKMHAIRALQLHRRLHRPLLSGCSAHIHIRYVSTVCARIQDSVCTCKTVCAHAMQCVHIQTMCPHTRQCVHVQDSVCTYKTMCPHTGQCVHIQDSMWHIIQCVRTEGTHKVRCA